MRNVWIFPLRSVHNDNDFIEEIKQLEAEIEADETIVETEKERIIKSRIGQSKIKQKLLTQSKKCALCGVNDERFLIASHIKPWKHSTNEERLDVNNGLLLCPNHDSLFDKGYISFDEDGILLVSDDLTENTRVFMNINSPSHLQIKEKKRHYLNWHLQNLFKS
jgi:predicted restriction endonuclease